MNGTDASSRGEIAVDVAIVGAGPAGLTAGYLLTKAGMRVAIIEKDAARIGRTVEHDGHRFDIGGHGFASSSQAVAELWNEIQPGGLIERPRNSRAFYEGKFYSHPPRGFEALRNLGVWRSAACMASYARAKLFPIKDVRSFEDWASNRFGRKLYSMVFKTYAEKIWGTPGDQISAHWADERLESCDPSYRVPEGHERRQFGPATIWEAACERIVARDGIVLMGHSLKQLASDGQGGWRMTANGPEGEVAIEARHAISSAPMRELAARLHPLPASTIEASRLKYRDLLTVAVAVRSDGLFPDDCIYVHDSRIQAGRVRNFYQLPESVTDQAVGCIGLEYFCREGDTLWSMRDDRLVELARREIGILGLISPDKLLSGAVVRQEKAYPVPDEGSATNAAAMRRELEDKYPTLHLIGRNGMHRSAEQDHAVMTAMLTAANILAGQQLYDTWDVSGDAAYPDVIRLSVGDREVPAPQMPQRAAAIPDRPKKAA
jgi:protoporphyrinogen oxidase